MRKKIKISIVLIVFSLILGIFLLNYFGVFEGGNLTLSTIPIDCNDGSLCKETVPPYICPQDVDFCQAKGEIECSSTTSVQKVIFRTNTNSFQTDGTWIAIDCVPNGKICSTTGNLHGYCKTSTTISAGVYDSFFRFRNSDFFVYNGKLYVIESSRWYYEPCDIAELSETPLEPYTSNNQEVTLGENPYSCASTFQVLKTDNTIKASEQVKYSQNSAGSKQTQIYRLEKGERAEFLGGTYSDSKIFYNTYKVQQTCTFDYCEGTGIRKCENGFPGDFISCDYGCDDGKCVDPYQVNIEIKDDRGFTATSFGKNTNLKIYVTISTPSSVTGDLTLELREGSVQGITYLSNPITRTFTSNTPLIFDYNIPLTGTYYLILNIDYPGLLEPEIYGNDIDEIKSFDIVDDFTANLRVSQTLGNVQNMNKFFTGYPIKVEYIFKEPGDTPILPDNAIVTYEVNGVQTELTSPTIQQDDFAGYYIYSFTPTQPGSYKFIGTATRGTFTTNPSVQGPYAIESDSIKVEYTISYNPVINNKQYTDIVEFTTKNRNGQFIDTDNEVNVKINGVESGTIPVKGSNGQYSIDYNFPTENADYLFTINSVDPNGIILAGELSTELIDSGESEDTFCKSDSECGFLGVCNSGNCETNVILIISVIVGLVILIVIIILAYTFIKNRKKQPSFGDVGL